MSRKQSKSSFARLAVKHRERDINAPAADKDDSNAMPPLWRFKAASPMQQFNLLAQATGKSNRELAQILDVSVDNIERWRSRQFKRGSHYAPAPHILERFVREFKIEPAYAEILLEMGRQIERRGRPSVNPKSPPENEVTDDVPDEDGGHWGEKKTKLKPESQMPIKGSGVATFLASRNMNPTPEFLGGFIHKSAARAKQVLLGAPMTEDEIEKLDHHLDLDAEVAAMVSGPGVVQLLVKHHLGGGSSALAKWLGDSNGHAISKQRIGEIMQGSPLTAGEIDMLEHNLTQAGKRLAPNELEILRLQPDTHKSQVEKLVARETDDTKSRGVA